MNEINFCSNCGIQLSKPSNFCGNCGSNLIIQKDQHFTQKLIDELNILIDKGGLLTIEVNNRFFKFSKEPLSYKLKFTIEDPSKYNELEKEKLQALDFEINENSIWKLYTLSYKEKVFEDIISSINLFDDLSSNIEYTYTSEIVQPPILKSMGPSSEEKDIENKNSLIEENSNYKNVNSKKIEKNLNRLILFLGIFGVILLGFRLFVNEKDNIDSDNGKIEKTSNSSDPIPITGPLIDQSAKKDIVKEKEIELGTESEEVNVPKTNIPKNSLELNPFKGKVFTFKSLINDKELNGVIVQTNKETTYHIFDFQKNIIHLVADFLGEQVQFSFPVMDYYIEKGLLGETHVFVIKTLGVQEIYLSLTNGNLGYDYDDGSRINHFEIKELK
ncbi:zinc ribbon domain-containing protein [Sphingobacterium sp. BS-2]|uniref:zinc ribbon domain-containing protein n=1 Tax=Sphingobacterium sp. BS-2 TaxID=3377129 RepID=UPI0038FCC5D2